LNDAFPDLAPRMIKISEIIPVYLRGALPPGAAELEVSSEYENGDIRLLPGPIIQIYAPNKDSELIIGVLMPECGGIVQEILYFSDDHLASKDTADKGEAWIYAAGKVAVMKMLLVMNEDHQPELMASLTL
jgi:hypothetical protein